METSRHQAEATQRARLRWRARRGLLENDIVLSRFLDRSEGALTDEDVGALTDLLDLSDNDLLDLILARQDAKGALDTAAIRRVLAMLRVA